MESSWPTFLHSSLISKSAKVLKTFLFAVCIGFLPEKSIWQHIILPLECSIPARSHHQKNSGWRYIEYKTSYQRSTGGKMTEFLRFFGFWRARKKLYFGFSRIFYFFSSDIYFFGFISDFRIFLWIFGMECFEQKYFRITWLSSVWHCRMTRNV